MWSKAKVIQVLPTLAYGDGVGNDTLAMDTILKKNKFLTKIYAENFDRRISRDIVDTVDRMPPLKQKDVVLYHLSTGSVLNERFKQWNCRKILIYHNITPPHFFEGYSEVSVELCRNGRRALADLCDTPDYCLADSPYNRQELIDMGYHCPIDVQPILIPFADYRIEPGQEVLERYAGDGYTNILFTGRISPNKKQEDIIESFACYQRDYNDKSRLILVGSYQGMEKYQARLERYAKSLGAQNVVFTGHIPFRDILAYYRVADLFLCLSEHEGFCIPLVEAMIFGIPIIAYDSTGVSGTLGEGGVLLKEKNPLEIAGLMHYVMSHPEVRERLRIDAQERLQTFQTEGVEKMFVQRLREFLRG